MVSATNRLHQNKHGGMAIPALREDTSRLVDDSIAKERGMGVPSRTVLEMIRAEYTLFDRNTQALVLDCQVDTVQGMLDFDYVCRRESPSVAAIVDPDREGSLKAFWGSGEIRIPVYRSTNAASRAHPNADVAINFSSPDSTYETTVDALDQQNIRIVAIVEDDISEQCMREIAAKAQEKGKLLIGPGAVAITAGAFRVGNSAGTIENIVASRLYMPGSVGLVSNSSKFLDEIFSTIAKNSDGVFDAVAIGRSKSAGSRLLDHLRRYEENPQIKLLVCLDELGDYGFEIADAIRKGEITKPFIIGIVDGIPFGDTATISEEKLDIVDAKRDALKKAGAIVAASIRDLGDNINESYQQLCRDGKISPRRVVQPRKLPVDFKEAVSQGLVRRPSSITSTISDDRGKEPTYAGVPMSQIVGDRYTFGDVIGLLWFKRRLPSFASRFFELVLLVIADHGPAVSGAHNAIVSAMAGKDVVSSLCSGLLTMGPRFGGSIDDAARWIKSAHDGGVSAEAFAEDMKVRREKIPGIGHRTKNAENPDKRVQLLVDYARSNLASTSYLDFALEVEKVTIAEKGLILNIDGCIAAVSLDVLENSGVFMPEEIDSIVKLGYLNSLFIIGRSVGIIGHIMDQYRLRSHLYRHAFDDILYVNEQNDDSQKWSRAAAATPSRLQTQY